MKMNNDNNALSDTQDENMRNQIVVEVDHCT